jgi:Uri superfamily endonuclease
LGNITWTIDNHQQVVKQPNDYKLRGGYLLLIHLKYPLEVKTRSKKFQLSSGWYVYVGSAMNTLLGRLHHHEGRKRKPFWHIDFLLQEADLRYAFLLPWNQPLESLISSRISGRPIPGFGASDVREDSHLFWYSEEYAALSDVFETIHSLIKVK